MRTEEEILKEFEKLGYTDIHYLKECYHNAYLVMKKPSGVCLFINHLDYTFEMYEDMCGDFVSRPISLKEFELLHELFKWWEWL